jgi:hypothetical protein
VLISMRIRLSVLVLDLQLLLLGDSNSKTTKKLDRQ